MKGGEPALNKLISEFGQRNDLDGIKAIHGWVSENIGTLTREKLERNLQRAKEKGNQDAIDSGEIALRAFELINAEKQAKAIEPAPKQPLSDVVKGMKAGDEPHPDSTAKREPLPAQKKEAEQPKPTPEPLPAKVTEQPAPTQEQVQKPQQQPTPAQEQAQKPASTKKPAAIKKQAPTTKQEVPASLGLSPEDRAGIFKEMQEDEGKSQETAAAPKQAGASAKQESQFGISQADREAILMEVERDNAEKNAEKNAPQLKQETLQEQDFISKVYDLIEKCEEIFGPMDKKLNDLLDILPENKDYIALKDERKLVGKYLTDLLEQAESASDEKSQKEILDGINMALAIDIKGLARRVDASWKELYPAMQEETPRQAKPQAIKHDEARPQAKESKKKAQPAHAQKDLSSNTGNPLPEGAKVPRGKAHVKTRRVADSKSQPEKAQAQAEKNPPAKQAMKAEAPAPKPAEEKRIGKTVQIEISGGYLSELARIGRELVRMCKSYEGDPFLASLKQDYQGITSQMQEEIRKEALLKTIEEHTALLGRMEDLCKKARETIHIARAYERNIIDEQSKIMDAEGGLLIVEPTMAESGAIEAKEVKLSPAVMEVIKSRASPLPKIVKRRFIRITQPEEMLKKNREALEEAGKLISVANPIEQRAVLGAKYQALMAELDSNERRLSKDGASAEISKQLSDIFTRSKSLKENAHFLIEAELGQVTSEIEAMHSTIVKLLNIVDPERKEHLEVQDASDELLSLLLDPFISGEYKTIDEYCKAASEIGPAFREIRTKYAPAIAALAQEAQIAKEMEEALEG